MRHGPYRSLTESDLPTKAHAALGARLASLPQEVLSEIFRWCCPTSSDRSSAPPMSPLALSHVCRLWRAVVFSTPPLWTYASLGAPRHSVAAPTALLALWIANAKHCPLVVDVDLAQYARFQKPDAVLSVVQQLAAHAARLRPARPPDEMQLTVSVHPARALRFPYFVEEYSWAPSADAPARGAFQLHASMHLCILQGMDAQRDVAPYLVHLDLVDHERTMFLCTREVLALLLVYPRLRHLAARLGAPGGDDDDDNGLPRGATHALPHLRTLCLAWEPDASPAPVLDALCAPRLERLELDGLLPDPHGGGGGGHPPAWPHLARFLARSAPPLRALELYRLRAAHVDLLGCLARCGSLERLWLEECTLDARVVRAFTDACARAGGLDRDPHAEEARRVVAQSLRTLGLVRCDVFDAKRIFDAYCASGAVWQATRLDGVYIADPNLPAQTSLHLLRTRYEAGEYSDLAGLYDDGPAAPAISDTSGLSE